MREIRGIDEETFMFAGLTTDESGTDQGKLAGSLESAIALHRLFTPEEVEQGMLKQQMSDLKRDFDSFVTSVKG